MNSIKTSSHDIIYTRFTASSLYFDFSENIRKQNTPITIEYRMNHANPKLGDITNKANNGNIIIAGISHGDGREEYTIVYKFGYKMITYIMKNVVNSI